MRTEKARKRPRCCLQPLNAQIRQTALTDEQWQNEWQWPQDQTLNIPARCNTYIFPLWGQSNTGKCCLEKFGLAILAENQNSTRQGPEKPALFSLAGPKTSRGSSNPNYSTIQWLKPPHSYFPLVTSSLICHNKPWHQTHMVIFNLMSQAGVQKPAKRSAVHIKPLIKTLCKVPHTAGPALFIHHSHYSTLLAHFTSIGTK